jgi:quercetin dioxygenase-like cupin family protein/hemerythrin-like domain-containing protein
VKRHPSLIPLSHDHHHALVQARRLRRGADSDAAARRATCESFLRFFSRESVRHFRQEEEELFPLLVDRTEPAGELLTQALLEHQRLHALVDRLDHELALGEPDAGLMRELGGLLEAHVRLEERKLFPLIQETLSDRELKALDLTPREPAKPPVVDLAVPRGRGPLWGVETDDLNATLLAWDAGGGPAEHVNSERDVLLIVLAGSATVTIDGEPRALEQGDALVLEKGLARAVSAGPDGVRYLSVHRSRGPLEITSPTRSG